jgi:modulator of FtsH protease HflK
MPWKDASKPSGQPGPWDPPGDPAPEPADETRRRRPETPPRPSPWDVLQRKSSPAPRGGADPEGRSRRSSPPPARGPDLDELGRQLRARWSSVAPRRAWLGVLGGAAVGLFAGWMASGLFLVRPGQTAIVTAWGAPVAEAAAGLHYHWPAPIGAERTLSPDAVNHLDLGSGDPGERAGRLLTRDGDLLSVAYAADWRVASPRRYLLAFADPQAAIRSAARAGMRQAVASTSTEALVAPGRGGAESRATALMQAALDRAGVGVKVVGMHIGEVEPPDVAQAAFRDLAAAGDEAELARRDAATYRVRALAEARADAAKAIQGSQGYRDQEVSEAKGEAERFALVDAEYRKAPEATRDRLYTETLERVLHNTPKVVVQLPKGAAAQINLPSDALRPKPLEAPPAGAASPPSTP